MERGGHASDLLQGPGRFILTGSASPSDEPDPPLRSGPGRPDADAPDVPQAAEALGRLRRQIDVDHMPAPAKLLVITATGHAFERPDGVAVAPLTMIGP